ncbi:F-box/WD repeat-containing protein 9-like isoform X1 [Schistocerca americana]|uniref:F-box/WD repeat-containing protein 9-like isoform X1 n=1 Tax=Schistocerca americana TaxID=7009 RepID=UPI001F4F43E0|nr:F-box/WD repeat-containing protein 9-like isoform X1 [Schistocerca americana]XP_047118024.1 F-box/WD repeat-containing protein 9-like isoform X1 [Schistocerca piceifrons]XP_049963309.1 F-box/WD repeat-containing protein 9-like isoform X1 [Schistocerca serialis cubense]
MGSTGHCTTASMSSESEEVQPSKDVEEKLQILHLPTEILLKIFSFLDAKFLVSSVSLVCRQFHAILVDPNMWKYRVKKRMKYSYPAIGNEDAIDWQRACVSLESERFYWTHRHETMLQLEPADYVHIAAVDSVALIHGGQLCVSGSRDRSLALWDLTSTGSVNGYLRQDAHSGWIWALLPDAKEPGTLYSCSWDYTVKCWDVHRVLEQRSSTALKAAVLSLTQITHSSVLACGQYTGHVALVDTRCSGDGPASLLRPHHRAALGLASWGENVLVSASEEGRLVTTDLRSPDSPLAQLTLSECFPESSQIKSYPTCLSVRGNSLYAGDSKGYVWLFDATGGQLKLVQSLDVEHGGQVTAVQQHEGVVLTASTDTTLRAFAPSCPLEQLSLIRTSGQVTGFDYLNGVLVTGSTNCKVEIYTPRKR